MRRKFLASVGVVVLCLFFFQSFAEAQFRASLRGVVTDPGGAVLPGSTVTLTNTGTNRSQTVTTDDNGIYTFNALQVANYQITAEHSGFKKKVLQHVQIIPDQLNSLNLQLEVGEVQESVTVTDTTQALDTETATMRARSAATKCKACLRLAAMCSSWYGSRRVCLEPAVRDPAAEAPIFPEPKARAMAAAIPEFSRRRMGPKLWPMASNTRTMATRSMASARRVRCGEALRLSLRRKNPYRT